MNRRITLLTIIAALIFAFYLPGLAAAQSNDPWGRDQRDQDQRDRDRDYRRDRRDRDDDQDRNDSSSNRGRYGYDSRTLRDAVRRLKDGTHRLQNDVDRNLDHSRINGSSREDHINTDMEEFRRAADRLDSRIGNGRDLNRSANEAESLISSANEMSREFGRFQLDSRTFSDWKSLQTDLHIVADAYGLNYTGGRDNGRYDQRYPNDRDRRNNNDWWRRIPGIGRP